MKNPLHEKLRVHCDKCGKETDHAIHIQEKSSVSAVVEARCLACKNLIRLPIPNARAGRISVADRLKSAIGMTNYRRNIGKR